MPPHQKCMCPSATYCVLGLAVLYVQLGDGGEELAGDEDRGHIAHEGHVMLHYAERIGTSFLLAPD